MLNAIQFPLSDGLQYNNVWKIIPVLHQVVQQSFLQMLSKITCRFTPHCNTIFHNKCQIQTSVLMSRAIHEAISSWLFQHLSIVKKKTCGDFGVLGITRLLDFLLGY